MRAVLEVDPHSGSGYAILAIYGIDPVDMPFPVLRRISDGMVLDSGGWRKPPAYLVPEKQETDGNHVRYYLSPAIVDNISTSQHYIIEIPGLGSCALEIGQLVQSTIVDLNGQDLYAPPPERPEPVPDHSSNNTLQPPFQNSVFEGVEPSPQIEGRDDFASSSTPVSPGATKPEKKGKGCLFLIILAIFIWVGGAWFLWHGSMKSTPASQAATIEENEKTPFFEIIPAANESSFVEEESPDSRSEK